MAELLRIFDNQNPIFDKLLQFFSL